MDNKEHTLLVCMEECSEIQMAISKGLRFGFENHHPSRPSTTNGWEVMKEFYQLCAVVEYALENGMLPTISTSEQHLMMTDKRHNLLTWAEYSRKAGIITDEKN